MKWDWRDVRLYDSDGDEPTEARRIELLRQYHKHGELTQYYLCDPSAAGAESDNVWDSYHGEWRDGCDAGPSVDEIDWAGFPDD